MSHGSQKSHKSLVLQRFGAFAALLCLSIGAPTAIAAAEVHPAAPTSGAYESLNCGELPLAARGALITLTDTTSITGASSLDRLEDAVRRHTEVADIFATEHHRLGLFSVGLDAVEHAAVMPLQRDPAAFADREWAHNISYDLLERYLANLHSYLTAGYAEPHWAHYFALSTDCRRSGAHAAMAGYNAHLTVDLAYAVEGSRTEARHVPDYYLIVDTIAQQGDALIDRTRDVYGADLGPLWRFYFVGEGLDALAGEGVATGLMLRAADVGYNTFTLAHGMALQDAALRADAEGRITELWRIADVALDVLARVRAL
ncbi:DUF5995 family protein [Hoyosella sp. YIM 151337]|uniref:DUF5995 family protein n=1 Tax=Hoyosella sp. YIM 151337 TaxID=2992742 RepID=UPI00223577B9|nr:DUF5995 family protein [Hoyosella sp. YIM 151337]MCW4352787.1 DUF5995 family protein [Hoyosella sp. YIM 151337]